MVFKETAGENHSLAALFKSSILLPCFQSTVSSSFFNTFFTSGDAVSVMATAKFLTSTFSCIGGSLLSISKHIKL